VFGIKATYDQLTTELEALMRLVDHLYVITKQLKDEEKRKALKKKSPSFSLI